MPVKEVQLLDEDDIFYLLKDWIEWHVFLAFRILLYLENGKH